jgi:hypothetical protein
VIQALVDEKETVGDTSNISAMFMNVEWLTEALLVTGQKGWCFLE